MISSVILRSGVVGKLLLLRTFYLLHRNMCSLFSIELRAVQRLIWSESSAVETRAEALAHDKRSAELLDRLVRGEKALRLGVRTAHKYRLKKLADRLRDTASELDKASRVRGQLPRT